MVLYLDGKIVPKIFFDNSKLYDVEDLPDKPVSNQLKLGQKDISLIYRGDKVVFPNIIHGNLELWYDFSIGINSENNPIIRDLSGNDNHGELIGFNFTQESGYTDKGIAFDAVDDRIVFNDITFNYEDSYTIDMTISNMTLWNATSALLGNSRVNSSGIQYSGTSGSTDSTITYSPGEKILTSDRVELEYLYPNFYDEEGLVNIQITAYDDGGYINTTMRINGEIVDTSVGMNSVDYTSIFNNLGQANSGDSFHSRLEVHSLRLYSRVLTEEELKTNYDMDMQRYK